MEHGVMVVMSRHLIIHLDHLHLRNIRPISEEYISFLWQEVFYFSLCYSQHMIQNFSIPLNHSLLLPVEDDEPLTTLLLQHWQNHMILFQHSIDISQLNTRRATRKKLQIRQGEILQYSMQVLSARQAVVKEHHEPAILQHYLMLSEIKAQQKGNDSGPSYFKIEHGAGEIIIPVLNAMAMIPLPGWFRFWHVKNGKTISKSKTYETEEIKESHLVAEMIVKEDHGYDIEAQLQWVTDLSKINHHLNALLGAHDVLLWDIQIRFEAKQGVKVDVRHDHVNGTKLKISSGNKVFELKGDLDPVKPTRFARIVYFMVKSEEEDFTFLVEKGTRIVAKGTVGTDQLLSYHSNQLRKKLIDPFSGRTIATVRFRGEKAKNLSLPQNNPFWKLCAQKKETALMLQFSQMSLWGSGSECDLTLKSQEHEVMVYNVPDFSSFNLQTQLPEPISLAIRQEGNIYLRLTRGQELVGMGELHPKELRLGAVPLVVTFYKQQQEVCECRMIANKVMPWPFVVGSGQPEAWVGKHASSTSFSVTIKGVQLTSYYWSYLYQGKGDLYCIMQVNKVKKVVILQRLPSQQHILFLTAPGSDLLNFIVSHEESFKLRMTLLASDQGVQEQIYGTSQKRVSLHDLEEGPLWIRKLPVASTGNLQVGEIDLQVQKGLLGEFKRVPVKHELHQVKQDLDKINRSIEKVQRKRYSPPQLRKVASRKRYDSLVLPEIKDPKQERLKRLAKALEAKQQRRKRPKINLTYKEEPPLRSKARVKSQGVGLTRNTPELDEPLPPIPLTVREEVQEPGERNSDLNIEIPSNQFQQNEFAEPYGEQEEILGNEQFQDN